MDGSQERASSVLDAGVECADDIFVGEWEWVHDDDCCGRILCDDYLKMIRKDG